MNCQQAATLLHPYVDGELDLVNTLALEEHLQTCAACAQAHKNLLALRHMFSANSLAYKAPTPLQKRIQLAIREADPNAPAQSRLPQWWKSPWDWPWNWRWLSTVATTLVLVALSAIGVGRALQTSAMHDALAQEVLASHVRSLMATHLTDVASSDHHTVKPWFDGKLDFAPIVEDLASAGFPLVGGRLDYLNKRAVAALVYQHGRHFINLFSWPSTGADIKSQPRVSQGYYLCQWQQAGMTYWAVSDLSADELQSFVQLIQKTTTATPTP